MKDIGKLGTRAVDDLHSFLQGSWSLYRTMNDLRLNMPGVLQGDARIHQAGEGDDAGDLVYREQGELSLGNHREVIDRTYVYKFPNRIKAPSQGEVHFEQGGLFHLLDLSSGFQKVLYTGKDDTYRGTFSVLDNDIWHVNWFVAGPAKEIIIDSRYQRRTK